MQQFSIQEQTLQDQVGIRIASLLTDGVNELPGYVLDRLQAARFKALSAFSLIENLADTTWVSYSAISIVPRQAEQSICDSTQMSPHL